MNIGKTTESASEGLEARVTDLEIRITHQNELLEQLNEVIYAQQKQIDVLAGKMAGLEKQATDPAPANEKPPHY